MCMIVTAHIALGLEPIWFDSSCSQVDSSSMFMQLFCLHVNSPRSQPWPILFFCYAKSFQMVKSFLQHSKIVAPVQSGCEFKKELTFLLLPALVKTILKNPE